MNSDSLPMENIVLVGRTGTGKSATGNSIVRSEKPAFKSQAKAESVTKNCESAIVTTPEGQKLKVIDTPGLLDLTLTADYISKQIIDCLHKAEGGLHAVLLVISLRNRVTKEEEVVLRTLEDLFGNNIVNYLILVFTAGDELEANDETIDDYLTDCPPFLQKLLGSCDQRKVVFDNRTHDEGQKKKQVHELLSLIDQVRKHNNNKPYTEETYDKIQEEKVRHQKEKDDLADQGHSDEKFEEMLKEVMELNSKNLAAMAEMMAKQMKMALDAQQLTFDKMEKAAEERHNQEEEELKKMLNDEKEDRRHKEEQEKKERQEREDSGCNIL